MNHELNLQGILQSLLDHEYVLNDDEPATSSPS